MKSSKDFYPFSDRLQSRTHTELLGKKDAEDTQNQGARQLLGIKGGSASKDIWAIRLQLCKPVTWIPLIWGVACGAAASGNYHTWNPFGPEQDASEIVQDAAKALSCMFLSGPILTGYTQTLNDWEDREIDAINEPNRPIPSGAISKEQVIQQIWVRLRWRSLTHATWQVPKGASYHQQMIFTFYSYPNASLTQSSIWLETWIVIMFNISGSLCSRPCSCFWPRQLGRKHCWLWDHQTDHIWNIHCVYILSATSEVEGES